MNKRQLPSDLEGDKVLRRVRLCQGFGSVEGLEDATSASFDLESAPEFLALNSPVTMELTEAELSETQENESTEERGENNNCAAGGKDKVSSSLPRSVQVLFLRSLEPEPKLDIYQEMDTVRFVWDAWKRKDAESIDNCLVLACEEILRNPLTPGRHHLLSLAYISRKMPEAFSFSKTYKILLKLLNSSISKSLMNRANLLPIFASKLLYRGFVGESEWPIEFIQAYLRDIVGPCAWIEHDSCKDFVGVLTTAFQDSNMIPGCRYSSDELRKMVQREYFISLDEVLKVDTTKDDPRVLMKLLLIGIEYDEARLIASSMLEGWINNPVYMDTSKALLDRVVQKTSSMRKSDISTVGNLFLLKIKNEDNNVYGEMVTELVRKRREYAIVALKTLVLVELSAKDMSNLKKMSTILRLISVTMSSEEELALILQELAANDNTRIKLKDFVCRVVRHIRGDINIKDLCCSLLKPWVAMASQESSLKMAWLTEMAELVTVLLLQSTGAFSTDENIMRILSFPETRTFSVSEDGNLMSHTEKEKLEALEKFSLDLAMFQLDAMAWCTDVVSVYAPNMNEDQFTNILKQVLFLGNYQAYFPEGDQVGEIECNALQLLGSCTSASEEVLARVILLGISDVYPLSMGGALSIIESLVWRAGAFHKLFRGSLHAESKQIPQAIIKLASFSLLGIPKQYFSNLVYKDKYWRACLVLLLLAVYNPGTIGKYVWENNSTVCYMMEVVITGTWNSSLQRKMNAAEPESEAMICDVKADELISSTLLHSRNSSRTASVDILLNTTMWKGNVTLINESGTLWRLPQSIIEELEQTDEIYELGHGLRKCRSPDFFAEITGLQTLQRAWPWLRRILPKEPELVCVLPPLWQCELLWLQEGLTACAGEHFVDTRQLYFILGNVVSGNGCEKEAEVVIQYFSCKFGDNCSLIRSQARYCLARILDTLFSSSEEVSLRGEGGHNLSVESNTSFNSCNSARREKHIIIKRTFSATDDYELGWLDGTEALPNLILSSLLPAIRTAVQVEISFEVVSSYLKFLEKHSPPLPSHLSAACVIARLLVQRKDFAASLLLRDTNSYMSSPSSSAVGWHTSMIKIILDSLCEALIVGTSSPLNDEDVAGIESSLVTLVVPQNDSQDSQSLRCITLHKIVLDAILLVLSLCSNGKIDDKCKNPTVERMIQILVPNVSGKMVVPWLESMTGQQLPLLSEEQAMGFAQSSDNRIAFAGYSALSVSATLHLCQSLGVPPSTVDFILDILNSTAEVRMQEFLKPMKENEHHGQILQACLQTLSMFAGKSIQNLLRILSQLSPASFSAMPSCPFQKSMKLAGSFIGGNEENHVWLSTTDIINSSIGYMVISDLNYDLGLLKGVSRLVFAHAELRKCIQRESCWDNEIALLHTMEASFRKFRVFEDHKLSWEHLCFLLLPTLTVLICSIHSTLENITVSSGQKPPPECEFQSECHRLIQRILSQMEMELVSIFNGNNLAVDHKTISVLHAKFIMAELGNLYDTTSKNSHSLSQKSLFRSLHVKFQESCSLIDSDYLALLGVEGSLLTFLQLKFQKVLSECCFEYEPDIFISEMLQFMLKISMRGRNFLKYISNLEEDDTSGNKRYIMFSGCCVLFTRVLNLLDLNASSNVCTSLEFLRDKETVASLQGPTHSVTRLFLENIAHESSWQVKVKVMKSMLETSFGMVTQPKSVLNRGGSESLITYLFSTLNLEKQADLVSVFEFLHTCSHHAQTVLVHGLSDQAEFEVTGKNKEASLITALSASCLFMCKYSYQQNASSYKIVEDKLISWAISLLVASISASRNSLRDTIENLLSLDVDGTCPMLTEQNSGDTIHDNAMTIIKELLWTIYFAFPLSFHGIPQADVFLENNTLDGFNILHSSNSLFCRSGQAFPFFKILQNSLRLVCAGTERESNTAYGFCHHLAKKHPALLLPHMFTLAELLKEKMLGMEKGEDPGCSFGHALYLVAGLLDALRPHIFDMYNSSPFQHDAMYSGLMEIEPCRFEEPRKDVYESPTFCRGSLLVIMDIYFEFLNNLDAVNLAQYLKVVLRLIDFLCHCVAAGKHCLHIVNRHQKLIQTTAQKFPKIKKLGFLLSLIENHDLPVHTAITDADELLKGQSYVEDIQVGPPMLPIDVVLKVQNQLQHFLSLQMDSSNDYSLTTEEYPQRNLKSTELEDEIGLLSILNDVEKASARVPTLLTSLEEPLIQLIKVRNKDIQTCTYRLLERLLLHCPSGDTSERVIKALLHNLKLSDISLAKMAAQQAVKFFYHCPELQETVLVELFLSRGFAEEDLQQLFCDLLSITG